jgi:CRP/FNR family transcriptional regulator, cyclic AMP receptor protein
LFPETNPRDTRAVGDMGLLDRFARDYDPGTVLFREGDPGSEMFVIQSGEVEISRMIGDKRQTLALLPAGEFFGEMAIINDRPRSATATVRQPSRLLVIDPETFEAMLRGKTEIAVRMIKALAGRLERANQQVELLLLKNSNHRVVQCLRQLADEHQVDGYAAVYIPVPHVELARRVALTTEEVLDILQRLEMARLVVQASEAGIEGDGYVVPEVGRLLEFLEFLELRDRFGEV